MAQQEEFNNKRQRPEDIINRAESRGRSDSKCNSIVSNIRKKKAESGRIADIHIDPDNVNVEDVDSEKLRELFEAEGEDYKEYEYDPGRVKNARETTTTSDLGFIQDVVGRWQGRGKNIEQLVKNIMKFADANGLNLDKSSIVNMDEKRKQSPRPDQKPSVKERIRGEEGRMDQGRKRGRAAGEETRREKQQRQSRKQNRNQGRQQSEEGEEGYEPKGDYENNVKDRLMSRLNSSQVDSQ